ALDRLDADESVDLIVVVSKPPAAEVAERVTAHAGQLETQIVLGYLRPGRPDITATAQRVVEAVAMPWTAPRRWAPDTPPSPRVGDVRGLYAGGTLCDEAMLIAAAMIGPIASNIPLPEGRALDDSLASLGHTFIDFGDDRLTQGRPHPMIDPSLRLERLAIELADSSCAVVLLDVVLGHAAHPDPATDLAALIEAAGTPVIVTLVGTRDDPQGLEAQAAVLADAGAIVHASNAAAVREALSLVDAAHSAWSTS
nr:FdrA family protein [Propionibacteriales bacterium]